MMMMMIYEYITRLASNEIFSPSNKIHREVGRAKDLSAPLYYSLGIRVALMTTVTTIFSGFPQSFQQNVEKLERGL